MRAAARGPARRYGQEAERRLREAAAGCGRARVLDPVAAELVRYREVREQYVTVAGRGELASARHSSGGGSPQGRVSGLSTAAVVHRPRRTSVTVSMDGRRYGGRGQPDGEGGRR